MAEQGGKFVLLKAKNGVSGAVTFTATGDIVGYTAHGLTAGCEVSFSTVTTTTTVTEDTTYWVINPTTDTFQLSSTKCGTTAVSIDVDGTGTMDDVYSVIGGIRSKTFTINAEAIDITNADSCEWREILDSAGLRTMSLSGSGVFENGLIISNLRTAILANTLTDFEMIIDSDGDKFSGSFKITSLEYAGEYNAEATYSISMESSGTISYTAAS